MSIEPFPVSAFNLKPNATIQLIGSAAPAPSARPQAPVKEAPISQTAMVKTIQAEIDSIHRELLPNLIAFEASLNAPEKPSRESLKQEYTRLGELLLQTLLRLDSFTPEGEWEEARKARKAAVKEIQELLSRVDTAWKGSQA
jgi:BAG domain